MEELAVELLPDLLGMLGGGGGGGNAMTAALDANAKITQSYATIFASAGQAVTQTASNIAAGATSIINDVGGAVTSAVSAVSGAVTALTASLGPVGAIIGGIVSALSVVTGTLVNIAATFASTLLSVATTILSTINTVVTTAVSIVATVISTADSIASSILGIIPLAGNFLGIVSAMAGAATSLVAGITTILGSLFSALTSVVSGIVDAITAVVGALTSAIKSASEALGQLAGIAGQALDGFISAIQSSVEALMNFANDVTGIKVQTGMDTPLATRLVTDLSAVGIPSAQSAQIFGGMTMNPELLNMRARVMGAPTLDSPNWVSDLAGWFQQQSAGGFYKQLMAKAKLNALFGTNQVSEPILRLVNKNPQKLQQSIDYDRQVRTQLGVGPSEIKEATEDLPLLIARISNFIEAVKMRFAADLLPSLEAAFSVVSDILLNNAGTISNVLKTATRSIFVDGPDIAANAANTVINWASALADMLLDVADAGVTLLETFGNRQGFLYDMLMSGARFIDFMSNVAAHINGAFAFFQTTFHNAIANLIEGMIRILLGPLALFPGAVDKAKNTFTQLTGFQFNRQNAFQAARTAFANSGQTNAVGMVNNMATAAHQVDTARLHKSIADTRQRVGNFALVSHQNVNDVHAKFGTRDERARTYDDKMLAVQQELLATSKAHLNIAKGKDSSPRSANQVLSRIGAYIAEDAYRSTSR